MDHYAFSFTPPTVAKKVPKYLTTLFDCNLEGKPFNVVEEECERVLQLITLTRDEKDAVELVTINQSSAKNGAINEVDV